MQVLRYTALGLGVFYGFSHQRSINSTHKASLAQKEYEHKQKLIDQAKAEWAKKSAPVDTSAKASGGTSTSGNAGLSLPSGFRTVFSFEQPSKLVATSMLTLS